MNNLNPLYYYLEEMKKSSAALGIISNFPLGIGKLANSAREGQIAANSGRSKEAIRRLAKKLRINNLKNKIAETNSSGSTEAVQRLLSSNHFAYGNSTPITVNPKGLSNIDIAEIIRTSDGLTFKQKRFLLGKVRDGTLNRFNFWDSLLSPGNRGTQGLIPNLAMA